MVREFINTFGNGIFHKVLTLVHYVTFGFSSLYVLIILTSKYFRILCENKNLVIYACINAILCYFHLLGPSVFFDGASITAYTNMNNIFVALLTALISTHVFVYIINLIMESRFKLKFTSSFNTAINALIPIFFFFNALNSSLFFFVITSITRKCNWNHKVILVITDKIKNNYIFLF